VSETDVLVLVVRYPDPVALARHSRDDRLFQVLRRLERTGLVRRRRGLYRLTDRGRRELALTRALTRFVARALSAPA
jgi:hypothetical protein